MRVFAFDLETTGINTETDEPVEIAYTFFDADGEPRKYVAHLIKSSVPINPKAQAVHGITPAQVSKGMDPREFVATLEKHFEEQKPDIILGYNHFRFDIPMLANFIKRHGGTLDLHSYKVEDPALWYLATIFNVPFPVTNEEYRSIAIRRVPFGTRFNLTVMTERLGIAFSDAHRAENDLKATIAVWRKMRNDYNKAEAKSPDLFGETKCLA